MIYRRLAQFTALLAFVVIVVGAYVRLEDAGLGCPDWPGCYGQLIGIPQAAHEVEQAERVFPGRPVDAGRARKEMLHRYLAGLLGLLVVVIAVSALRRRSDSHPAALPIALLALVVFQATLGMWTVTLLLKPAVVTLHLIGGMTTFALLTWLALREMRPAAPSLIAAQRLRPWTVAALTILACQIALGGWVSSNYAALACPDLPTCHGEWVPDMDFRNAFHAVRELGVTVAGAPLPHEALTAIHWSHRVGALATLLVLGGLALVLMRTAGFLGQGVALLLLVGAQLALGIANVAARLPLALAVAHNAGAAVLLAVLVMLNFTVFQGANGRD
ncbi:MAG TPA: COX15/CtaA family protein [Burkholderiales bacterium]|nr:COX15/CtaA family protein [Burkholderiales bacterium]